ncbi:MAG: hypothetical protein RML56_08735 [Burkholderiales bacterium]|nr:hypothetical protein [Burkholderiales bacterium]
MKLAAGHEFGCRTARVRGEMAIRRTRAGRGDDHHLALQRAHRGILERSGLQQLAHRNRGDRPGRPGKADAIGARLAG